jgi:hypothetical protein
VSPNSPTLPTRRERIATVLAVTAIAIELWSFLGRVPFPIFVGLHVATMLLVLTSWLRLGRLVLLSKANGFKHAWNPFAPRLMLPGRRVLFVVVGFLNLAASMLYAATTMLPDADVEQGAGLRVFASGWLFFALAVRLEAAYSEPQIARIEKERAADGAA